MQRMTFSLNISPDKYERYYRGSAKAVLVTAHDGRTLKFPASNLTKFVTHEGIKGIFSITFNDDNKIVEFRRVG